MKHIEKQVFILILWLVILFSSGCQGKKTDKYAIIRNLPIPSDDYTIEEIYHDYRVALIALGNSGTKDTSYLKDLLHGIELLSRA